MQELKIFFLIIFGIISCSSLNTNLERDSNLSIIPKPQFVKVSPGKFTIVPNTSIIYDDEFSNLEILSSYLNSYLDRSSGFKLLSKQKNNSIKNSIYFKFDKTIKNKEGYKLTATGEGVVISASSANGIFYGIQTLFQLLPVEIYSQNKTDFLLDVPFVEIRDEPRFKWRGIHLDVGRHFYNKEYIKKYLDYLAMHKINRFHWHLTEDQGWRIEIKKYPKLTKIGAWRKETMGNGKPHGGFYTQEDIKEIVKYAADRFITIIPEIEMPGHSVAALAAYPELSCTGGPFEVETTWGVHKDVYCAGNEKTFQFLEDVLSEVMTLFPSKYIHIGGDECPKDRWKECTKCQARIKNEKLKDEHELQSYFIKRIEKFLNSKGRQIIGWDEILEGGLAPNAVVMSWRGIQGGINAAKQNHDVIMTPGSYCYFDHYQGNPANEPKAFGGYLPLTKVYSYEPIPKDINIHEAKHVLGAQANLWTEYLPKFENVEYMLMPRISAIAEVNWTKKEAKNLDDFICRMDKQFKRYEFLNANYAKSAYNVTIASHFNNKTNTLDIELSTEISNTDIFYTLDGTTPTNNSIKYSSPLKINKTVTVKAVSYKNNNLMSTVTEKNIKTHKAFGKNIEIKYSYSEKYSAGGKYGLVNGLYGSTSFSDGNWQGYEGVDLEAVIDLGELVDIKKISSTYLQSSNSWIFMPKFVEYSFSSDGINFSTPVRIQNDIDNKLGTVVTKDFSIALSKKKIQYIKVLAKNIEKCPAWHQGAGGKAWLFVDEITVE